MNSRRLGNVRAMIVGFLVCLVALPAPSRAASEAPVVSKGNRIDIKRVLKPENTTVVLFVQNTSAMEQQFLADLENQLFGQNSVALRVVRIKDIEAPVAKQFEIAATPTAVVYDRFGRMLARTSLPDEIKAAIRKGKLMARIQWVDEDNPKAPEVYGAPAEALKRGLPGIVKSMALRPDAFRMFNMMSTIHFSDGFLKRREHEMIAAYVSGLNKCKF